ncbi:MAG TPA: ComEA family DNA-binding protein [Jiangellaceae bacterium]
MPVEQAELARSRVTAMSTRRGWLPRVPTVALSPLTAPDLAESGLMSDVGANRSADPGTTQVSSPNATEVDASPDAREERSYGRHAKPVDATGSALTDRLPLPVRAVIEGLPPSVRTGHAGLQPAHAVVVVLVVLLGLAVTALLTGLGRPRIEAIDPIPASTMLATGTPVADPAGAGEPGAEGATELVVHVAGEVAEPGIVRLPPGSRVVDAIEAAGGATSGVDLTPLNLARVLTDGEQVAVGIDPPPQAAADPGAAGAATVSLNSASAEQLATLPGIGPTLAARIVQWREQNGRYTAVDELLEVSGIGPAKYDAIAGLVTL